MPPRIVYSTDPDPDSACPRCGCQPCICNAVDLPAKGQTAYIKRERKGRAGKTVTTVYGLQHTSSTFRDLLKTLKTHCGAGGTVREDGIEIQGDHRERIAEKLNSLGYRVKLSGG